MKAVLIGSVSSSAAALRGLLRGGLPPAAVCGLHRRHAETVSDYHDLGPPARAAGIPYVAFDRVTEPSVRAMIERTAPDWLLVIGLSQLVPADMRALARLGSIGFHPTMLPEGRGRAPVAWTILLDRPAAANLFFLTDEADAGDIIAQRPVEVRPDDYAADLIARTNVVLEDMVADLCPALVAGQVPRTPQDHSRATYYPRRRPEDGLIDWTRPTDEVYRLVRAVSRPYPGAFTFAGGRKLIIWRASPQAVGAERSVPGTVIGTSEGRPLVCTGNGALRLIDWQWPEGPADELAPGMVLGAGEAGGSGAGVPDR